ncbi:hypothetical protein F4781DRAFT_442994 [Annulohypoxylon bovei var. microspora]|nr:hypothetical protein F4781DRAFT_442994 [Annulohypoxylon bovei var. microspora]
MAFYQRLCNELRLEVWEQAAMVPGMHHFYFFVDRQADGMPGHNLNMQTPVIFDYEENGYDPSAWRRRTELMGVDAASRRVMTSLIMKPSSKKLWPCFPLPLVNNVDKSAFVLCDLDMICFKMVGEITASWARPVVNNFLFAGIKRISIEYDMQYLCRRYNNPPFRCQCNGTPHANLDFCPAALDKFLAYFPDLEKLFFIKKVIPEGLNPSESIQIISGKRDYEGMMRNERNVQVFDHPRITRMVAYKQHFKDTYDKFRSIAKREKLASFEDKNHHYYEVRECDSEVLVDHDKIWNHFSELEDLWATQKDDPNLGHAVKEVELGLLVYIDPQMLVDEPVRSIKAAKSVKTVKANSLKPKSTKAKAKAKAKVRKSS